MTAITKVWTCKLPADSELNKRLRTASKQAGMPYYRLLEKMLELWEEQQAENGLRSDDLNARVDKIEKFMNLLADEFHNWLEWDSETGEWIKLKEQHNEAEAQADDVPIDESILSNEASEKETADKIHEIVENGEMTLNQIAQEFISIKEGGKIDWNKNKISHLHRKYYPLPRDN